MITNDQLLKLFVLVPSTVENFNGATVSGAANEHRLFFEQSTGLLWAKGLSFGGKDSELAATVHALIGEDGNKTIRAIAGEVLAEAMDLADDANTTIDNLTEVLKWFKDLPEEEEGALKLIAKIGKKGTTQTEADTYNATLEGALNSTDALTAEQVTAYNTAVDGANKSEGDTLSAEEAKAYNATLKGAKTAVASTGLYKEIEDAVANVDLSSVNTRIGTLETTVGDSNSGLVKSVADNSTAIGQLQTTVGGVASGLVKDVNDLKTTVGDANSGLVKSVAEINGSMSTLGERVTALEEFDPWENYVVPSQDQEPEPEQGS
jgi:hypothetical protein